MSATCGGGHAAGPEPPRNKKQGAGGFFPTPGDIRGTSHSAAGGRVGLLPAAAE